MKLLIVFKYTDLNGNLVLDRPHPTTKEEIRELEKCIALNNDEIPNNGTVIITNIISLEHDQGQDRRVQDEEESR